MFLIESNLILKHQDAAHQAASYDNSKLASFPPPPEGEDLRLLPERIEEKELEKEKWFK